VPDEPSTPSSRPSSSAPTSRRTSSSPPSDLKEISERFLRVVEEHTGRPFPRTPSSSWRSPSRRCSTPGWASARWTTAQFHITPEMANGTAVNVCTMVFGNRGNDSATGVAFTRSPETGENKLYGEYLVNAQGEDVVAGIRTPKPIERLGDEMPQMAEELAELRDQAGEPLQGGAGLRVHHRARRAVLPADPQRQDERPPWCAPPSRWSQEGLITKEQALLRVDPMSLEQMLFPRWTRRQGRAGRQGPAGLPGRRRRHRRVRRRPRRAAGQRPWAEGHPGARGDQARGHPRLLRRRGHPHLPRRQDLARRRGRARHGQALRRRCRGHQRRCQPARGLVGDTSFKEGDVITIDGTSGKVYLGPSRPSSRSSPRALDPAGLGRRGRPAQGHGQRRHPGGRPQRRKYGAVGIGLAAPSACSTPSSACRSSSR
jgi:pyruvate,orthophosphate dikinase